MAVKIVILIGLLLIVLLEYSLCVVSHDADERAERMYERWNDERSNNKTE